MRIDKFDKERSNKYIPGHKQFVQLFNRHKSSDVTDIVEIEGELVEVIVKYAYEMQQLIYNIEWEQETTINEEGEEVFLSVAEYIDKRFDELWGNN